MALRTHPLLVVAGSTGSGKSSLALRIAEEFCGEIVNCDSIQVYRHFDIGAAKLTEAERRGIPHHLIDILEPDAHYTAGEYAQAARRIVSEIGGRGHLPVVAGGTGFYLRALLQGLFSGPARDLGMRDKLKKREMLRPASLHRILRRLDPVSATRIHPNDVQKTIRALEVRLTARRALSEFFEDGTDSLQGFRILKLILNPARTDLVSRLDERLQLMFENGLVEETQAILNLGFTPSAKPFESLGYRQALLLLDGEMTRAEAIADAQVQTRRYAKRQVTWFRREPDAVWLNGFGTDARIEEQALALVASFVASFMEYQASCSGGENQKRLGNLSQPQESD